GLRGRGAPDPGIPAQALVVEDGPWVVDARIDAPRAKMTKELVPARSSRGGDADRVLMEDVMPPGRFPRELEPLDATEPFAQHPRVLAARLRDVGEPRHLGDAQSGLQLGHAEVEARSLVVVSGPLPLVPQDTQRGGDAVVVGRDDSPLAGGDVLGGVEREAPDPEGPDGT